MLSDTVELMRPRQWTKNLFVILPLFFSGNLTNLHCWRQCAVAFVAFSLMASAIYCINDIKDRHADALHPVKRSRPVACGRISTARAAILAAILASVACGVALLGFGTGAVGGAAILLAYFVLNIAYCFRLKHYSIVDVMIIAAGFVLRVWIGGYVCSIWVSPWIVCLTFLLTLFMAFAKRRDDVLIFERSGARTRDNVSEYNLSYLDQVLGLLGSITMVCYVIYTLQPEVEARLGCEYVYLTSVFVLAGILRYLQIALVRERSGSPTEILMKDRFVQTCLALWALSFIIIIYFL